MLRHMLPEADKSVETAVSASSFGSEQCYDCLSNVSTLVLACRGAGFAFSDNPMITSAVTVAVCLFSIVTRHVLTNSLIPAAILSAHVQSSCWTI